MQYPFHHKPRPNAGRLPQRCEGIRISPSRRLFTLRGQPAKARSLLRHTPLPTTPCLCRSPPGHDCPDAGCSREATPRFHVSLQCRWRIEAAAIAAGWPPPQRRVRLLQVRQLSRPAAGTVLGLMLEQPAVRQRSALVHLFPAQCRLQHQAGHPPRAYCGHKPCIRP